MDLADQSDVEILAVANPLMDNLMDASTLVDYERHTCDYSERLKAQLSKARLIEIYQDY
jgi:hypothetical protein